MARNATTLKLLLTRTTQSFKQLGEAQFKTSALTITDWAENGDVALEGSRADVVAFAIEHRLYKEVRVNHLNHLEITKVNCAEILGQTYRAFSETTPAIGPNRMQDCTTMLAMVADCMEKLTAEFADYATEAGHH